MQPDFLHCLSLQHRSSILVFQIRSSIGIEEFVLGSFIVDANLTSGAKDTERVLDVAVSRTDPTPLLHCQWLLSSAKFRTYFISEPTIIFISVSCHPLGAERDENNTPNFASLSAGSLLFSRRKCARWGIEQSQSQPDSRA